jgi:hypothetical protein
MADDGPLVELGASLRLKWPTSEDPERKAVVIQVSKAGKLKHESWYKYVIQFRDNDECVETRLKNLEFKIKKRDKESSSAAATGAGLEAHAVGDDSKHKKKKAKRETEAVVTAVDSRHSSSSGSSSSNKSTSTAPTASAPGMSPVSHIMQRAGKASWNIPIHKYICAPMVGASELAFRLLTRRYGCQLAYTPMISSARFAVDEEYRKQEFQSIPADRPLVCHFSANDPAQMLAAARHVEHKCDAIDLNLGCPQRVAFVGSRSATNSLHRAHISR